MSLSPPPKHRKSPIRHTVRTHTKKTPKTHRAIKIKEYMRGKGKPKNITKKKTIGGGIGIDKPKLKLLVPKYLGSPEEVNWRFITQDETVDLNAPDIQSALNIGLKKVKLTPRVIRLKRLSD
jgi:hypothetical protein